MPPAAARHLPPLPVRLQGRPFGLEDDGRPIKGVTGASFELTLNYLRQCVGQRAAAELPAGATTQERAHAIARAQSEALDELVARLNTAIADPRYQVTLDTLQRKGHRFSFEFSAYLAAVSAELSGDPRFYFHRLAASAQAGPKPFYILLRALPLGQAYRFFPSLVARLADTRLEVVEIKETSAVVRWHAKPHQAQVPAALWPHFVEDTRGGLQGTLALLPTIHSNLPAAEVTERVSCLDGNPYDEWVFTWQAPQARGWFESRRAAAPDPPPAPETQFLPRPPLPALPARLQAPAFGRRPADPAARGINRYDLNRILAHLVKCVRGRAEQALPAGLPAAERDRRLDDAEHAALQQLLERLNAVRPGPPLTLTDLVTAGDGYYSLEFTTYLQVFAAEISGDPAFHFNRGAGSTYPLLAPLLRNFDLSHAYRFLPALVRLFSGFQLETVSSTATSALVRWHAAPHLAHLPADLHPHFIQVSCQAMAGALSALPRLQSGLAPAQVREWQCRARGDACCEWEFTWQNARPTPGPEVWAGLALAVGLAVVGWPGDTAWRLFALALAPICGAAGWLRYRWRLKAHADQRQAQQLAEQREQVARQYDELQRSSAELQLANLALREKVAELTSLNEVGRAISANLGLDELLDRSLQAILTHLHFDRASVMLIDAERNALAGGRRAGGTPEMAAAIAQFRTPLDGPSPLALIARTGQPLIVHSPEQLGTPTARALMRQFGSPAFVGVPMQVGGRVMGVLLADNAVSQRPLPPDCQMLLLNVGSQIACAVDRAQLYLTLEARVEARTAEARESEQRARVLLEREQRHAQELALLDRVRAALVQELELSAFFRTVVEAIAGAFGYRLVSLFLIDGERLQLQALAGQAAQHTNIPLTAGIVGQVARSGEPVLAVDAQRHPAYWAVAAGIESELCVPLKDEGRTVGVLDVETEAGVRLGEADLQLMLQLAEAVSLALRNARLYAHLQQELSERQRAEAAAQRLAEELEALHATITDLSPELSLPGRSWPWAKARWATSPRPASR